MSGYLATGHPWEALFENWESEFLQMAVFVLLTTFLIQKGSPESRRPGVKELVDTDPRDFADDPEAPWPVRRGGWILRLYEHSLGLAFVLLFLISWVGHALGGFAEYAADQAAHHQPPPALTDYLTSAAVLVRIVPELAERIPGDRVDGVARGVPATALVAGVETRACAARRNRTLRGHATMAVQHLRTYADVNAVVGGYLRDLAFAQSSQQKMFGYKRAAAAILALDDR